MPGRSALRVEVGRLPLLDLSSPAPVEDVDRDVDAGGADPDAGTGDELTGVGGWATAE